MELFALSPDASDFYTLWGFVVGVVSLVVGVGAFGFAIVQIREARDAARASRTAAEAARDAARQTLAESKEAYGKFIGGVATRLLSSLEEAVESQDWRLARVRTRDLAELLESLQSSLSAASALATELRVFGEKFAGATEDSAPKFSQPKWNVLVRTLH